MPTPQQQVIDKCRQVMEVASRKYNVDMSAVRISFNLRGRVAGYASWKRRLGVATYGLRFNHDMIGRGDADALADMVNATVPHDRSGIWSRHHIRIHYRSWAQGAHE